MTARRNSKTHILSRSSLRGSLWLCLGISGMWALLCISVIFSLISLSFGTILPHTDELRRQTDQAATSEQRYQLLQDKADRLRISRQTAKQALSQTLSEMLTSDQHHRLAEDITMLFEQSAFALEQVDIQRLTEADIDDRASLPDKVQMTTLRITALIQFDDWSELRKGLSALSPYLIMSYLRLHLLDRRDDNASPLLSLRVEFLIPFVSEDRPFRIM